MANILINFSSDTGGLDEANKKLEELRKREKDLIEEVETLKYEYKDLASEQAKAVKAAADNEKDRAKAVLEYEKALIDTKKEVKESTQSLRETKKEIKSTSKEIDSLSKAQKNLENIIAGGAINNSFKQTKYFLEEQLRIMRLNGEEGSEKYEMLRQKLVELNVAQKEVTAELKQQSSATYVFDSILQGTQIATGGVSILTGAFALFGKENKEVQQLMLKLNALTTINTGLQQFQNAVKGEGNIIQRISIIQTAAETKAKALSTKGTIGATIAQKAFNLVAYANPYVLLAVALITVVGALYLFSRNTETAAGKQKRLNELQREALDIKDMYADSLKTQGEQRVRELERELALMEAQGKSEAQLALKRKQINAERERNALTLYNNYSMEANSIDENTKRADKYRDALRDLNLQMQQNNWKGDTKIKFRIDDKIIKDEADKIKEIIQGRLDLVNLNIARGLEANNAVDDARNKAKVDAENDRKKAAEAGRRSAIAEAEYRVLITKKGSQEELSAQISALEVKKRVDLQNANITKGERLKIAKDTELQIQRLKEDYNRKQLQDELDLINVGLSATEKNSEEEYQYKLKQAQKKKEIDLSQANLSASQRKAIEIRFDSEVKKLAKDRAQYISETEINTSISGVNTRLAKVKEGSLEEHNLRIELAKLNAQAAREDAQNSIENEEYKAARIKEINANLQKEILSIRSDSDKSSIAKDVEMETLFVTQQYEKGKISRRGYENEINRITIDSLNKQIENRRKYGEDTIDLEQELADKRIEISEQEAEARKAVFEELANTMQSIGNTLYDSSKERLSRQLEDLNHYYTTDADAAKKNKDLKLVSEEELAKRQLQIKRELAKAEKDQALFNAFINMALGVTKALSSAPPPFNIALAALTAAASLVQINAIASRPLPKYWKGRKSGKGEHALVGEYGPEIMWIPQGASIMPAHDSFRALNGDVSVMSKWNMPAINPSLPVVPNISQQLVNDARKSYNMEIDYDKMGRAVAKYSKPAPTPKVNVSFDKSGLSVTNGNRTTNYLNIRGHV